jgi:peptidyl-prolyl cis-trans isomerase A (cyclophilin A)
MLQLIGLAILSVFVGSARAEEPAVAEATKEDGLYAVFQSSMGSIVCRLHYDKAPVTVANFVGLATGEKEWRDPKTGDMTKTPFYNGLKFHRCIPDFGWTTSTPCSANVSMVKTSWTRWRRSR